MNSTWFTDYLKRELNVRNVDGEVYSDYIANILHEGCEVETIEEMLESLQISNHIEFAKQLVAIYLRGSVLPEEISSIDNEDIKDASFTASIESIESLLLSDNSPPINEANNQNDFHNQDIASPIDVEDDEEDAPLEVMDWLSLMEAVEQQLGNSYSSNAIYQALLLSGGNIETAIAILKHTTEVLVACKPCRHLLSGRCSRSDCLFDHNLAVIPCRYWLSSQCAQEQIYEEGSEVSVTYGSCPFKHECESIPLHSNEVVNSSRDSGVLSEESFPSLISNNNSNSNSSKLNSNDSVRTQSVLNFTFAKSITQHSNSVINNSSTNVNYTYSSSGSSSGGGGSRSNWKSSEFINNNNNNNVNNNNSSYGRTVLPSEWVESGRAVGVNYETLRSEAREFAIARNKLLEEATKAFRRGDRGAAKQLSVKGQELNRLMKQCHCKAAQAIFKRRNTTQSVSSGGVIDLHGLHVAEAIECLDALLPALQQSKGNGGSVRVVTGSGHHTIGPQSGKSRLFPAVKAYCEGNNEAGVRYRVSVVKDENGYAGGLIVHL